MAEYIVAFVLDKIAGYLIEEAGSFSRIDVQVEWIEAELRRMQCFLQDAEMKQNGDERVKNWVADIRDIAYDTDDLVDFCILKVSQQRSGFLYFLKKFTFLDEVLFRRKVNKHIDKIKKRIAHVKDSRSTYGIENLRIGTQMTSFSGNRLNEKRRSFPCNVEDDIIGLEDDIEALMSRLIHGDCRRSVISIIGMAGLGKTTLAKKLYLSRDINKHFDCCAWVYVSQEYRARDILLELGKKLMGSNKEGVEKVNDEDLMDSLRVFLSDKRYLIVLDDIWKHEHWDDLRPAFPEMRNGSRIILTTRFKDVALYADVRDPPHELRLLDDDRSWELFSKRLCVEWNCSSILPPWSEKLGQQIVKRCGGLPLAIVVLAGLLSRKEVVFNEWQKVLQSVNWQLKQGPAQCEEILALSYSDLPSYLKPCFLYLGLFPEDFEISARRLTLLWVAEGFVQPRGQERLEDVAEDYLEELIGRSMVQAAKRKSSGRIKACRVHDLFRDLCISRGKEEILFHVIYAGVKFGSISRARRLAINSGVPVFTMNVTKIRSLLFFNLYECVPLDLKKFKLLRVLDLEGMQIAQLSSAIGDLIHLRYLGLRETWLKNFPSSIGCLSNLQTLDLRSTLIDSIPLAVWKLQQLRHLHFSKFKAMVVSPPYNSTLPNLHTLHGICLCESSCMKNGVENLVNLRELGLYGDLHLHEEAVSKWIHLNKKLEELKIQSSNNFAYVRNAAIPKLMSFSSHIRLYKLHFEGIISNMLDIKDFPPNLTELSLEDSFLKEDPMPILEKLPSLRVLKMKQASFLGKELVCSSGGFPQLQYLKFSFLTFTTWTIEDGALSNLRQLEIVECNRLKIVPKGLRPLTTLRELKLGFMPVDMKFKVQDRQGESWYKIQQVLPI
ncbi:hypothetical protein AgCh_008160 [Apium graveolens]